MIAKADLLISEINQIKAQYVVEVGHGRRAWPVSIKRRVAELESLGLAAKSVSTGTGIPYATIVLWRFKRRKAEAFKEVRITPALEAAKAEPIAISKSVSVTLPNLEMPSVKDRPQGLSLRTPMGFVIENLDQSGVLKLLSALSAGGQ
jgi:hypothetical protein